MCSFLRVNVRALLIAEVALRLVVDLDRRSRDHPPKQGFGLDWIVRNAFVRWQEDGVGDAAVLADRLGDALGWLVAHACRSPTRDENVWRVSDLDRRIAGYCDLPAFRADRNGSTSSYMIHSRMRGPSSRWDL